MVTELTVNYSCARFISHYGCDAYHKYNKKFQIHERQKELLAKLQDLNLEELN